MPVATNGQASLHWESQGSGDPVLLIIGHRFRRHMWYPVAPALSPHYRILTMDNRGMGDSSTPPGRWSVADMADDALAVLDAAGIERAHVHGMSMGGVIAQDLAIRAPDRVASLVLGCTAPWIAGKPDVKVRPRHVLTKKGRVELVTTLLHGPAATPEVVTESLRNVARNQPSARGTREQKRAMLSQRRTEDEIRTITAPTLVLHGTADVLTPFAGAERLAALIPDCRLVPLDGAGHFYMADATADANAALLGFLDEHRMPGG